MKDYKTMTPEQLIRELVNEVVYDAHNSAISYNRSDAKGEILLRKNTCLEALGDYIEENMLDGTTMDQFGKDERATTAIMCILWELSDDVQVTTRPYATNVPFGEQEFAPWVRWCRENQS
jgi:hypothetical protein